MDISTLLASFTTIQPATKNPTIDDQIKVHVATLEAFNSQGQLRSLVDNSTVDPQTISQESFTAHYLKFGDSAV